MILQGVVVENKAKGPLFPPMPAVGTGCVLRVVHSNEPPQHVDYRTSTAYVPYSTASLFILHVPINRPATPMFLLSKTYGPRDPSFYLLMH